MNEKDNKITTDSQLSDTQQPKESTKAKDEDIGLLHQKVAKPDPSNTDPSNGDNVLSEKMQQGLSELNELKDIHDINKAFLNIPIEFEIKGIKLEIKGKALRPTEIIDSLMYDLMIATIETIPESKEALAGLKENSPEYLEAQTKLLIERITLAKQKNKKIYDTAVDILYKILNDEWNQPAISKDWIEWNIPITDPSKVGDTLGMSIIKAYRQRCNSNDFFLELSQSRALA